MTRPWFRIRIATLMIAVVVAAVFLVASRSGQLWTLVNMTILRLGGYFRGRAADWRARLEGRPISRGRRTRFELRGILAALLALGLVLFVRVCWYRYLG